jgi:hypothetical protein
MTSKQGSVTLRRYRGCLIEPGPVRVYMGYGANGALVPGWVTTCECGLKIARDTQSELRAAITSHKWYGRPAPCSKGQV